MSKGSERSDDQSLATLLEVFSGSSGAQAVDLPGGIRAVVIRVPDPRAAKVAKWAAANSRPERGTPEQMTERRTKLFERLKDIDPWKAMELAFEYFDVFPRHPGIDDLSHTSTGASYLGTLESYIFDPDRLVAMCKALQDAVRKVAATISGPVYVLEAGYGLGYVALSALALNDELDNRVKIIGLETNTATVHRAAQILDYYGIDPRWIELHPVDATRVDGIPADIHILVAEHFSAGVFCNEPLYAVHRNCIPQLKEPFFIVPEGLDIHGRIIARDEALSAQDIRQRVIETLGIPGDNRALPTAEILRILGKSKDRELIAQRLLTRIRFADVLNGKWNGGLDLKLTGTGLVNGKGTAQLRGVPTFHTDDPDGEPFLYPYRFYVRGDGVYFGTSINWWAHVRDATRVSQFMHSEPARRAASRDPVGLSHKVHFSPELSPVLKVQKGVGYEVSIAGQMDQLSADIKMQEVRGGGSKKR